jgi:hypothetical protein
MYDLDSAGCISDSTCSIGTVYFNTDENGDICTACPNNCEICNGDGKCLVCTSGKMYNNFYGCGSCVKGYSLTSDENYGDGYC